MLDALVLPAKVSFFICPRKDSRGKTEYGFYIRIDGGLSWCITSFPKPPTPQEFDRVRDIVKRSFHTYHNHFTVPPFYIVDESQEYYAEDYRN